jgi:cell division septation protein DedD
MPAERESETISETNKDAVVSGTTEIIDSDTPLLEIGEVNGEKPVQETVPEVNEDDSDQKLINYWKENQANYYEPEPKSNRSKWWLLLLLIPLGIGVYFLIGDRQKSIEKSDSHQKEIIQKSDNQSIIPADSLKSDSISTDSLKNAIEEKKTEEPVKTVEASQKYYLIGGSFSKEENMENYIVKLKKKGIDGIRLGKKGKFFLVGIAGFETDKEAYKALNAEMRTNPEKELWILKK